MSQIVKEWMKDADSFEFQKLYGISNASQFDFVKRQDDFYITLLNIMYNSLQEMTDAHYYDHAEKLVEIAQAMLVYSEKTSEQCFSDIDKVSNHLYVASLYFLAGYEAVATYVLREYIISDFSTVSAQCIYYIVSGGAAKMPELDEGNELIGKLRTFMLSGDNSLNEVLECENIKFSKFSFSGLDDFFDTAILLHVLKKYSMHNLWESLRNADNSIDWTNYIRYSKRQHILSLLPSQEDALTKGLLEFKKSFSLKMPTSAGKSYITELVIYQEFQKNPEAKILYLAPLRSLSRELKQRFSKVGNELGFTVRAIYGGSTYTIEQDVLDEAQMLISTPETFITLEDTLEEKLNGYTLIICDEGQLLDSLKRGINYELLLTRLKKIEGIRFLFLSAIIPNIMDVNTWLGGSEKEVGDSKYRPCPIKLAQLKNKFDLSIKDSVYSTELYKINDFLSKTEQKGIGTSLKAKSSALAIKACIAGPTMLFTANKTGKMGCSAIGEEVDAIIKLGNLPNPKSFSDNQHYLDILAEYVSYQFGSNHPLPRYLRNGFSYHHGSMPQDIRELVEEAYEKRLIPLIICTTTLAEGVNLPVQTIVLYNLNRYNSVQNKMSPLDITEIKNIVGRAGRAGRQRFGIVIFPNAEENGPYNNTVDALKDHGLHQIMGTLYDVVRVFDKQGEKLDDNRLNYILEEFDLAPAIDTMITRSAKIDSFDEIDIDEIVKESLAYHVGDDGIKENLKRVFRIRHAILSKSLNKDNFVLFHNTGMTIGDVIKAEDIITEESLNGIDLQKPLSSDCLRYLISVVCSMPSFNKAKISHDGKTHRDLTDDELFQTIVLWINGLQYYEIAAALQCPVDDSIDLIMYLQNGFRTSVSTVIRYLERKGKDISELSAWIDMLKYGVNTKEKLLLIKSGLVDRVVVNQIVDSPILNCLNFENAYALKQSMIDSRVVVETYLKGLSLPVLCFEHLEKYLN